MLPLQEIGPSLDQSITEGRRDGLRLGSITGLVERGISGEGESNTMPHFFLFITVKRRSKVRVK